MIIEITKAIMKKYKSNLILRNALTGLYFQQAPQTATSPYGVFFFNGATFEEIMGDADDVIATADIQFSLFSSADDGGEDIAILAKQLDDCFNWQTLFVDDYNSIKMQRESIVDLGLIDEIWQITIMYSLSIAKE